jgi:hypothetical protein
MNDPLPARSATEGVDEIDAGSLDVGGVAGCEGES